MAQIEQLLEFQEMWTWLSEHPAHDRDYYMRYVVKLEHPWPHNCPMSTDPDKDCDSCALMWNAKNGNLCTDPESPLNKWKTTNVEYPDKRTHYAGQLANLAVKASEDFQPE